MNLEIAAVCIMIALVALIALDLVLNRPKERQPRRPSGGLPAGVITSELTAWCAICPEWRSIASWQLGAIDVATWELKAAGWELHEGLWHCPRCSRLRIDSKRGSRPDGPE